MYSAGVVPPLSPPISPRMAGQDHKPTEPAWTSHHPQTAVYDHLDARHRAGLYSPREASTSQSLPNLHEAYNNLGNPSPATTASLSHSISGNEADHRRKYGDDGSEGVARFQHRDSVVEKPSLSDIHSARLAEDDSELIDDDAEGASDGDVPKEGGEERQLTAAEIRQQKRKMKRFRLTHSQTRFLLAEFARQHHPDAAHREKLSAQIPGLSPRQVQVWFQNRRAKLKRLSVEDQERVTRSRTLPENFSMQLPGHQQFLPSPSTAGPSTPGLPQHPTMSRLNELRPLTLDTFRRGGPGSEHSFTSPTGMTPALGALSFTPPQSATDTQSPISATGDMNPFAYRPMIDSPRRGVFPSGQTSAPPYTTNFPAGLNRMPSYERIRTSTGEPLHSPLRTSMSYSNLSSATPGRAGIPRDMPPPSGPVGLGFTFDSNAAFSSSVSPAVPSSGAGASTYRGMTSHPSQTAFPSYFDYSSQHYAAHGMHPYQASYPGGYTSPIAGPGGFSAGAHAPHFSPLPSQNHQYGQLTSADHSRRIEEESEGVDAENSGVPMPEY